MGTSASPGGAPIGIDSAGVVSLTLRTLDEPLCGAWPIGTHFLWHLLNAVTLWLVSAAIIRRARAASRS